MGKEQIASYRRIGQVREMIGWSSRQRENNQSFLEESMDYTSNFV